MNLFGLRFFIMLAIGFFSIFSFGGELMKPTGPIILTMTGNIQFTNSPDDKAEFDLSMIESMGLKKRVTTTPWTDGVTVFEGVFIKDLLDVVGAAGKDLKITALNDYSANMPIEDLEKYKVLLALKQNGKMLRIRDKGPLFVVYPFDEFPELQNEIIHNRSVWQVKSIRIE